MTPSKYQKRIYAVFQHTNKNMNISAVAGSGKTTTLLELLNYVPKDKNTLFLAFNNAIVDELRNRVERKDVKIMTIHSCGWHSILHRYGKVKMNPNKGIAKAEVVMLKNKIPLKRKGYFFYVIPKLLDLMRCNMCENDENTIIELANHYNVDIDREDVKYVRQAFELLCKDKKQFDFMDMIYVPVVDPTIRFDKYACVFCDESQDFSLCQQEFIKRCIARNGRIITVGDERQAIYGFAGADANSYQRLSEINGKSIRMPLSVCYRCARNIVSEVQDIVPEIESNPDSPSGVVRQGSLTELKYGDWVVCRNLKPLIQTYLWLLKNHIKAKIRGKDIAEGIIAMINKTGASTLSGMMAGLERQCEALEKKLRDKGVSKPQKHPKMDLFRQKFYVIETFASEVKDVEELKRLIDSIFSDDVTGIILTTIHKAKGLENERIFFLCPELIPSKFATQPWEFEQERNLYYVAVTRAKRELVYVMNDMFLYDLMRKVY